MQHPHHSAEHEIIETKRPHLGGPGSEPVLGRAFGPTRGARCAGLRLTPAKLKAQVEESIARYLAALETADRQEGELVEAKAERLKQKIAALREQMADFQAMEAVIEAAPDRQVSRGAWPGPQASSPMSKPWACIAKADGAANATAWSPVTSPWSLDAGEQGIQGQQHPPRPQVPTVAICRPRPRLGGLGMRAIGPRHAFTALGMTSFGALVHLAERRERAHDAFNWIWAKRCWRSAWPGIER